jgi:hypothetical protein
MIDYLIHAYKIGTEPFRSVSALPDAEALGIMRDLYMEGSIFWERFENPAGYLQVRRQVEEWLRCEFIAKGGKPQTSYPIYMILGRPVWIETMLDAPTLATTVQIQIPLSIFNEWDVSFTYPDSMVSFIENYEKNAESYLPEYHGKVFTLCEIRPFDRRGEWAARGEMGNEAFQRSSQLHRGSDLEPGTAVSLQA